VSSGTSLTVLSREGRATADAIVGKYPNPRSAVLPLLFLVQSVEGYVSEAGMREVAEIVGLTPAQVLATASFYTMLKQEPEGEYRISICRNIACTHLGGRAIINAVAERLGIEVGSSTPNGRFYLEAAECLATCDGAPSAQINYEDVYHLSVDGVLGMIDALERGDVVRSVRGEVVKTLKEISYEIATAGLRVPGTAGDEPQRTIGGESPRADTAPGMRPKEPGADGDA